MKKILLAVALLGVLVGRAETILLECEQFKNLGGWSIDSQFIDEMGSSYLLAHGLGKPVADATRVMRTHGMMGEVVGMAASLCKKHGCGPRGVYADHLDELKALMTKGVGLGKLQPPQDYNCGACKFHK